MKTLGTQTVKNGSEDGQNDESDHLLSRFFDRPPFEGTLEPGLYVDLMNICKELFSNIKQSSHVSLEELLRDVIEKFGGSLHRYTDKEQLRRIVINVLIKGGKEINDQTHRGEM